MFVLMVSVAALWMLWMRFDARLFSVLFSCHTKQVLSICHQHRTSLMPLINVMSDREHTIPHKCGILVYALTGQSLVHAIIHGGVMICKFLVRFD